MNRGACVAFAVVSAIPFGTATRAGRAFPAESGGVIAADGVRVQRTAP